MPISKKKQISDKINTYFSLFKQGVLVGENLQAIVTKGLDDGELIQLKPKPDASEEFKMFLASFGLLGQKKTRGSKTGIFDYIKTQYPEVGAVIAPAMEQKDAIFTITVDGEKIKVAFQPFWRRVKETKATSKNDDEVTI